MWIVYMNIFDILIHDITNIKSKTMVQKRSFYMNVTNLKRVRRRSLTRMRKQNTTLKSHIRLTIVSFNKLYIILDRINWTIEGQKTILSSYPTKSMAWHCVSNRRHFGSKCRTRYLACAICDQSRENRGHENHRDRYRVRHLVWSIICDNIKYYPNDKLSREHTC